MNLELEEKIKQYMTSLNEMEKKALKIAKTQLESSFEIEKSIGFLQFLKKINN